MSANLNDWRHVGSWNHRRADRCPREELASAFMRDVRAVAGGHVVVDVEWRPPVTGVFDRLQQRPPTTIKGVVRYRVHREAPEGVDALVQQAIDFDGDEPSLEDLARLFGLGLATVRIVTDRA